MRVGWRFSFANAPTVASRPGTIQRLHLKSNWQFFLERSSSIMIPKGRILCTEDDPDTRDLLILMLSAAGYDATCTKNAEDALLRVQHERFDLFLLDNWLPGTSGLELCKQIRQFDLDTPILFYSGAAFESDRERAIASGAQGY